MSKLIVYMSMSLDGFVTAEHDGPGRGLGDDTGLKLHAWLSAGNGSPSGFQPKGVNAEMYAEIMSSGAVIVGRHTYEWAHWNGQHHDVPIFVLTHYVPEPATEGDARYIDDIQSAVTQAKAAAGGRNVMMHGASSVQSLLRLGLVDEFVIGLVPILLGNGRRLFDDPQAQFHQLELIESRQGEGVLHVRYQVKHSK